MLLERKAFTLVELLVVITIIVVLLALLAPALEKAIYQAELTVCGTKLRAIGSGVQGYALNFNRHYPLRQAVAMSKDPRGNTTGSARPFQLTNNDLAKDDRPTLEGYVDLQLFLCPLTAKIDLETPQPDSFVYAPYNLWYGWQWADQKGMFRMGDRFTYFGTPYNLLASDWDGHRDGSNAQGTHPDHSGILYNLVYQDRSTGGTSAVWESGLLDAAAAKATWSIWDTPLSGPARGLIDINFAYDNGSVQRFNGVKTHASSANHNDERMDQVRQYNTLVNATWVNSVPR